MATPKIREGTVSEFPVAAPSSSPTFSPGEMTQSPAQGSQGHRLAQLGQALMEVAHEVRSSLGAMQLCAGLLEEQLTEDSLAHGLASKLLSGMVHLSALVEDLLLFGETGALSRHECHLVDVLERALEFARPHIQEKSVRVTRLYAGDLEAVRADARLLSSVFLNLTLNAVEAMSPGGELVVVLRADPADGQRQEVRFEDTGPGFCQESLDHLFEPFSGDKSAGAGLGLAVSARIVQAHDGSLEVANRRQGGAAVTVRLPV